MIRAALLSERLGSLARDDVERLRALVLRAGLPVELPRLGTERYLALMGRDKKVVAGSIRFVLLRTIGDAFVTADVPMAGSARGARSVSSFRVATRRNAYGERAGSTPVKAGVGPISTSR
jgi:3-dehydroquinate synthase